MSKEEIIDELCRLRSDLDVGYVRRPQEEIDKMILALTCVIKNLMGTDSWEEAGRRYTPVCPKGFIDCVSDPAYIKYYHPQWYGKIYRGLTPQEAADIYCSVREEGCYDDEDK